MSCLLFQRISRWWASKGFGLQSPFAYRLQMEVIGQSLPYYAYLWLAEKRKQMPQHTTRQWDELLFRLANYLQPHTVVTPDKGWETARMYIEAACSKALWSSVSVRADTASSFIHPVMYGNSLNDMTEEQLESVLERMSEQDLMVVSDIRKRKDLWIYLQKHPHVTVTFDLYNRGLVFFSVKTTSGHYVTTPYQ